MPHVDYEIMSEKSYSNCPLKKRPVQIVSRDEFVGCDVEDRDIQPIDLSATNKCESFDPGEEAVYFQRWSPQQTSRTTLSYSLAKDFLERPANNRQSLIHLRESSISPPAVSINTFPLDCSLPQDQFYLNHNNNVVRSESSENGHRPLISPSLSHISFSSVHSDNTNSNSEPEDLSVNQGSNIGHSINFRRNAHKIQMDGSGSVNNREDRYYQCTNCKKCYSTAAGLVKHEQCHLMPQDLSKANFEENVGIVRSVHFDDVKGNQGVRPHGGPRYQCPDCGKSYSTYSGLTKHQQFHCPAAEGNQVKKFFSCKNCDKVYVSLGALKMHIRTHTLPCKCPLCGKAFSRPWLLQGHIRTHTGEKPFSCQHCNRAFADRSNLRAHLQTHSDVKKYSCSSCSKTFSRMSLLGKHLQSGCPGNSVNDQTSGTQIKCDYAGVDQSLYYASTVPGSYTILQSPEYPIHQEFTSVESHRYKEDIHAF